jgi:hypothetical protein
LIITLVFQKNANFFAENCRKSPKIVIITSTPDLRIFAYSAILFFGQFFENDRNSTNFLGNSFPRNKLCINYDKNGMSYILGIFSTNSSGHPGQYICMYSTKFVGKKRNDEYVSYIRT